MNGQVEVKGDLSNLNCPAALFNYRSSKEKALAIINIHIKQTPLPLPPASAHQVSLSRPAKPA